MFRETEWYLKDAGKNCFNKIDSLEERVKFIYSYLLSYKAGNDKGMLYRLSYFICTSMLGSSLDYGEYPNVISDKYNPLIKMVKDGLIQNDEAYIEDDDEYYKVTDLIDKALDKKKAKLLKKVEDGSDIIEEIDDLSKKAKVLFDGNIDIFSLDEARDFDEESLALIKDASKVITNCLNSEKEWKKKSSKLDRISIILVLAFACVFLIFGPVKNLIDNSRLNKEMSNICVEIVDEPYMDTDYFYIPLKVTNGNDYDIDIKYSEFRVCLKDSSWDVVEDEGSEISVKSLGETEVIAKLSIDTYKELNTDDDNFTFVYYGSVYNSEDESVVGQLDYEESIAFK